MAGIIRAFFRAPSGVVAVVTVLLLLLLAVVGPMVWGDVAAITRPSAANQGISALHWLGTDQLGRDVLARTLAATRLSLLLALGAASLGASLGFLVGGLTAVLGRRMRTLLVRFIDVLLAFPGILVAIVVTAIVGPGPRGAVLAIAFSLVPFFARIASTLAASVAGREFIASGRVLGLPPLRLFWRHVLPNIGETLAISLFNAIGLSLVLVSSLSFLGLGVQAPLYDWGRMLIEGAKSIYVTPAAALAPAVAIAIAGMSMGFVGEALARAMNPVLWTRTVQRGPGHPTVAQDRATLGQRRHGGPPPLLEVDSLTVRFPTAGGMVTPVDHVSFRLAEGETVGIVGESGSGKSLTTLAIAQLIAPPGVVEASSLRFRGGDLHTLSAQQLSTQIAMIFQDPMSSLNPALNLGLQLTEAARFHRGLKKREALELAVDRLQAVHMPAAQSRLRQFAHELSGGMRQRTMIAMGLMNQPALIIADEPTTALDVTVQAQILDLLREINQAYGTAILLISHDMGVVTELCQRVLVMYAGHIVEDVSTADLLRNPLHPYTRALMQAVPDIRMDRHRPLVTIAGRPPDLAELPAGCPFAARCPDAVERCRQERPELVQAGAGHAVACWVAEQQLPERRVRS